MTTKILVTLRMIVRPEKRNDFMKAIRGMLEPARVGKGCLSYRFYEDVENKNAFVLLEEWVSRQDAENHIRTDIHGRILSLMDLLSEKPELQFNFVSDTKGMDFLENVLFKIQAFVAKPKELVKE